MKYARRSQARKAASGEQKPRTVADKQKQHIERHIADVTPQRFCLPMAAWERAMDLVESDEAAAVVAAAEALGKPEPPLAAPQPPADSGQAAGWTAAAAGAGPRIQASLLQHAAWLEEQLGGAAGEGGGALQAIVAGRDRLPARLRATELIGAIESNQVTVVSGATGCGKSTQVPQLLLERSIASGAPEERCIVCTQPRRISAVALATRVAEERGGEAGRRGCGVGFRIRLESALCEDTRLVYCTTGVLLRRLLADSELHGVTDVVVDEAHERSLDSDFLLVVLRDLVRRRPDLRLVIMSATIDSDKFASYFAPAVPGGVVPRVEVPGFTHPVAELYLEDVLERIGAPAQSSTVSGRRRAEWQRAGWLAAEQEEKEEEAAGARWRYEDGHRRGKGRRAANDPRKHRPKRAPGTVALPPAAADSLAGEALAGEALASPSALYLAALRHSLREPARWSGAGASARRLDVLRPAAYSRRTVAAVLQLEAEAGYADLAWPEHRPHHGGIDPSQQAVEPTGAIEVPVDLVCSLVAHIDATEPADRVRAAVAEADAAAAAAAPPRAILVFVPGLADIAAVTKQLQQQPGLAHLAVVPLHGSLPTAQQRAVFARVPSPRRKVVVATNIAETSITIDDVAYVIDCGLHKEKRFSVEERISTLLVHPITRANAEQRRGRAGRVAPGVCFHLFPRARMDLGRAITSRLPLAVMRSFQVPEMLRVPLEQLVLQVKALALAPTAGVLAFLNKAIDPPDRSAVEHAVRSLGSIGALLVDETVPHVVGDGPTSTDELAGMVDGGGMAAQSNGGGGSGGSDGEVLREREVLTPVGQLLSKLPMHPQLGLLLLMGVMFGCVEPALRLAAVMSARNPFLVPLGRERQADEAKRALAGPSLSDHRAMLRALDGFEAELKRGGFRAARQWCSQRFLSTDALKMASELCSDLRRALQAACLLPPDQGQQEGQRTPGARWLHAAGRHPNRNGHSWPLVCAVLSSALYPNIMRVDRSGRYGLRIGFLSLEIGKMQPARGSVVSSLERLLVPAEAQKRHRGRSKGTRQDCRAMPIGLGGLGYGDSNQLPRSGLLSSGQVYSRWLGFFDAVRSRGGVTAFDATMLPPLAILLLAGRSGVSSRGVEADGAGSSEDALALLRPLALAAVDVWAADGGSGVGTTALGSVVGALEALLKDEAALLGAGAWREAPPARRRATADPTKTAAVAGPPASAAAGGGTSAAALADDTLTSGSGWHEPGRPISASAAERRQVQGAKRRRRQRNGKKQSSHKRHGD